MKNTLEKVLIPLNDLDRFEFILLDDMKNPINVDLDLTIDDIRSDSFMGFHIVLFLLEKKQIEN